MKYSNPSNEQKLYTVCVRIWGTKGFPNGSAVKNPPAMQELQEMWVQSLGLKDSLEKGMATHSIILAWRISWTEEPGRLYIVHEVAKSQTLLKQFSMHIHIKRGLISNHEESGNKYQRSRVSNIKKN